MGVADGTAGKPQVFRVRMAKVVCPVCGREDAVTGADMPDLEEVSPTGRPCRQTVGCPGRVRHVAFP